MTTARSQWSTLVSVLGRIEVAAWRAITSPQVSMALLAALLLISLLGGLLPQAAPDVQVGSPRYQEWRGQMRLPWHSVADTLETLGLFRVFHSRLFYLFVVLVAVVAFLRLAALWIPSWAPAPPRGASPRDLALLCDEAGALEKISPALRGMGLGVVRRVSLDRAEYIAARRVGAARSMPGFLYLGVLILLLAAVIEWRFGWVGSSLDLALGETRPLGGESDLAARLEQIDLLPLADGTLQRFDSHVSLIRGTRVENKVVLGLNRRATYQGLSLYQVGFGPAVRITARGTSGQPLALQRTVGDMAAQGVLRLRLSGRQQEQLLTIPGADMVVRLVYYPSLPARDSSTIPGAKPSARALHVQLLRGSTGKLLAERFLEQAGEVSSADVSVGISFEYSVTIRPEREPGLSLAAIGGLLILAGLVCQVIWPPREVWLIVWPQDQGCHCRLIASRADADAPWLAALAAALSGGAHV